MKKYSAMNGHEKAAYRAIKEEFNWMVGGWYNSYQDGYEDEIPALQEAMDSVYEEAMSTHPKEIRFATEAFCREVVEKLFRTDVDAQELWGGNNIIDTHHNNTEKTQEDKEMKNNAREEARAYILKNYTAKEMREHLKEAGFTGYSRAKKEDLAEAMLALEDLKNSRKTVSISKVNMFAFTGMFLGEFEAEVQDGKILVNTTSKGELMFDLETGKEITDPNKARYANRVEAV